MAADSRIAIDGFELPDPLTGTVVLAVALTVVLVVLGAAVVGGVVDAVVALLPAVPWVPVEVPAGSEAGAVWAEAGPACSTRKRPARSAKDATHFSGLTTSILVLVLIGCIDRLVDWVRGRFRPSAGSREV